MNSSVIPDARYQELNISFTFQNEENKLIIIAHLDNTTYQTQKTIDPDIDFDDIRQALNNKQFKIVSKTTQNLKLKVGFMYLEFKNYQPQNLNQINETMTKLTEKLNYQIQKNNIHEKLIEQLRVQMDMMTTQKADMGSKIDDNQKTHLNIKEEIRKTNEQVSKTNEQVSKIKEQVSKTTQRGQVQQRKCEKMQQRLMRLEQKDVKLENESIQTKKGMNEMNVKINGLSKVINQVNKTIESMNERSKISEQTSKKIIEKMNNGEKKNIFEQQKILEQQNIKIQQLSNSFKEITLKLNPIQTKLNQDKQIIYKLTTIQDNLISKQDNLISKQDNLASKHQDFNLLDL